MPVRQYMTQAYCDASLHLSSHLQNQNHGMVSMEGTVVQVPYSHMVILEDIARTL